MGGARGHRPGPSELVEGRSTNTQVRTPEHRPRKQDENTPTHNNRSIMTGWPVVCCLFCSSCLENVVLLQQPLHVLLREVLPDVVRDSRHAPDHLPGPVEQQRRQGHRVVVAALRRRAPQPQELYRWLLRRQDLFFFCGGKGRVSEGFERLGYGGRRRLQLHGVWALLWAFDAQERGRRSMMACRQGDGVSKLGKEAKRRDDPWRTRGLLMGRPPSPYLVKIHYVARQW